jgi:tetratricopeptide (TPR) repeat protein
MLNEGADSSFPKYYAYNPVDTIGNYPFLEMLRIDSARVEYLMDHPISQLSSIDLDSLNGKEKTPEQRLHDDIKVHAEAEAKWHEMLRLCSQRQYEELLSMYIKEETNIGIALATSTNKFELDYLVIGLLLFDQLEEEEAAEIFVKFLEYDKFLTESVVLFGESQLGYVPPQYAFQLEILCRIYLIMEDREKAEALIEPYRKAIYLLSDDVPWNESMIAKFKSNIYEEFGDLDGVIETAIGYRDFLIQYAKDNDEDYDDLIREIDSLVRKWEMNK